MSSPSLSHKVQFSDLHREVCKMVRYGTFPVRELAERTKELRKRFNPRDLSLAFQELLTFERNLVRLTSKARNACYMLLGPEPHKRKEFYKDCDPRYRPDDWNADPPVIPEREIDPITDGLRILTHTDLTERLAKARRIRDTEDNTHHLMENALETIQRVESEMVRRGQEIPPEPEGDSPKRRRKEPKEEPVAPPSENGELPKPPEGNPFEKLTKKQLAAQLKFARSILEFHAADSPAGQQAKQIADQVDAEMKRRGMEIPSMEKATK